jgi:hypothetical protein
MNGGDWDDETSIRWQLATGMRQDSDVHSEQLHDNTYRMIMTLTLGLHSSLARVHVHTRYGVYSRTHDANPISMKTRARSRFPWIGERFYRGPHLRGVGTRRRRAVVQTVEAKWPDATEPEVLQTQAPRVVVPDLVDDATVDVVELPDLDVLVPVATAHGCGLSR